MTEEEKRRKRPEHHVVHDYANLVSSGKLRLAGKHQGVKLLDIAPVNSHVWHAFYMNCRKMFEFFQYQRSKKYLRAKQFVPRRITFDFEHWTRAVQEHMNIHLMHVGGSRTVRKVVWTGKDDALYLADFEEAWAKFLGNLKPEHRDIFRDEIDYRLASEFRHCGDLGKQFIP